MPTNLTGQNISLLSAHFQTAEGISASDVAQIISDAASVFSRCLPAGTNGLTKGLIYGDIQSGKTAVILALIAVAVDNGYERIVVLTSDLNDLYIQTLDRTKNSLHGLVVLGKADMRNPANAQAAAPTVLVASKNVHILRRALTIVSNPSWSGKNVLIIDDEADQASLDTAINKPLSGPSGVNREIIALRGVCPALAFIQTTATPQALLLQDANAPFRPDFVQVTTPGTGYCGGDVFFISNQNLLRSVPLIDVVNLRANQVLPPTIEAAILGFLASAATLRLQGSTKNFQALVHTSLQRREHGLVTQLVDAFTRRVTVATTVAASGGNGADPAIIQGLQNAYADVTSTGSAASTSPNLSFQQVLQEVATGLPSTEVVQINSTTGQGVQANPNRRHVLYIGGAKLGRGVTIKNLLMTYYARDAQSPQIDTVLQHARMYGYRQRELPFTRIWLPDHLAVRFREIHLTDNSMRDVARATGQTIPVIPIPLRNLHATRRNVLSRASVELTTYIGGRQYYPLVPTSAGASIQAQTATLDGLLQQRCPVDRQVYNATISDLLVLLGNDFGTPGAPGAWDDDLVRQAVDLLANDQRYHNTAQLIVGSRSSNVSKLATRGVISQIQALLPANAGNPPYGSRTDVPVLVFMRLNGLKSEGWDGIPFWVPNLRFPNGNYAFSLNRT